MSSGFTVKVLNKASIEIIEAARYYDEIRLGLGDAFEEEIIMALDSLKVFWWYEVKFDDFRTYRLKRFPYTVCFRVLENKGLIQIESVLHSNALSGH